MENKFKHWNFVNTPIIKILEDAVLASNSISHSIRNFAVNEYIMQSVFLKSTGFQEQKLKCILWDIATYNYDFRYELTYGNAKKLISSQMSNYADKEDLLKRVVRLLDNANFDSTVSDEDCLRIIESSKESLINLFRNSPLRYANSKSFNELAKRGAPNYEILGKARSSRSNSGTTREASNNLLSGSLKTSYDEMYRWRNRLAHNTQSYQFNNSTFDDYRNRANGMLLNYFEWFLVLMVIDQIFIEYYGRYAEMVDYDLENRHWIN